MGWGKRAGVTGQVGMVGPGGDRTVDIADVSKAQLAAALNEQSARFEEVRNTSRKMLQVLTAIALEPEAFAYQDGRITIAAGALKKVKLGMKLHIDQPDDNSPVVLRVDLPEAVPQDDPPRIIIPKGIM